MSEPRRTIVVGLLPRGGDVQYTGDVDPVAEMIRQAGAELDRQRAAEARALASKAADIERAKGVRRARSMRKLRRALRAFGVKV